MSRARALVVLAIVIAASVAVWWSSRSGTSTREPRPLAEPAPMPATSVEEPVAMPESLVRESSAAPEAGSTQEAAPSAPAPTLHALHGRVLDERGEPLVEYEVRAELQGDFQNMPLPRPVSRNVRVDDGRFTLEGLAAGTWKVSFQADGFGVEERRIDIPLDEPLEVVLARRANVAGIVTDPRGIPLAGAKVRVTDGGHYPGDDFARSGWDGSFHGEVDSGYVILSAEKEGFAPSEYLSFELGPSETRRDLELRLRFGGSIVGEVVDADGRALEKAWVILGSRLTMSFEANFSSSTHSDARGHFEFTDVPPGDYELETKVTGGLELRAATILAAGETVFVRLEPPRTDLTRLRGRITFAGEPRKQVQASVKAREPAQDGDSPFQSDLAQVDCAADGSYELVVPAREVGWFHVMWWDLENHRHLNWRTEIQVPSSPEHVFDLDLPLGHIRGTVRGSDGRALAGVRVVAHPGEEPGWNAHYGETDAEGRYDLEVVAGVFTVRAGEGITASGEARRHPVQERQPDLAVAAGQVLERVDFVLREGCEVAGVARLVDGTAAAGVALYSWSDASWEHIGWSGADGSFRLAGFAPGTWSLAAASRQLSTRRGTVVEAREGLTATLELTLLSRVQASVRAIGSFDGELLALTWTDDLGQAQTFAVASGSDFSLGWVFPGRHYFHLQAGGRTVEQLFVVRGNEPEVVFELALPDEPPDEPQDWPEEPPVEPPTEDSGG